MMEMNEPVSLPRRLLALFLSFFRIGLFTFGGGYAMIALIEAECVEKKKWITHDEMMDLTVIAESTPGSIAVNCATYVGCRLAGIAGSAVATLGVVLPSFLILYAISLFLDNFLEIAVVANAFRGIRCAVGLLVLNAGIRLTKKSKRDALSVTILVGSSLIMFVAGMFGWKPSSVTMMLAAAAVGIAVLLAKRLMKRKEGQK